MMLADRTGVGVLNKNVVKGRMLHDPALCVQSSGQAHRGREESVVTGFCRDRDLGQCWFPLHKISKF